MNLLDLVYLGVAGCTAPWWMRKARGGWRQRFCFDPPDVPPKRPGMPRILLHAVSVGEVAALRSLVPMLIARGAEVVVSSTTDTGLRQAHELYSGKALVVRFPLDASFSVRRFLDAVRPDVLGLVELELWPNCMAACRRREIPVAVINGRLSERSFRGYRKIARWMRPSFEMLAAAAVQDQAYADRFVGMGTPPERVSITGSMKFDAAALADRVDGQEDLARDLGIDRSRPLVVAGSTGPGEEALLHVACLKAGPEIQLLCAPRRPERFDEAAGAIPGCARRSCPGSRTTTGRYLLDTIGELRKAYALADVVVVGRSFPPAKGKGLGGLGGSDPIEPISLGKATLYGPDAANFRDIVEGFVHAGGLVQIQAGDIPGSLVRTIAGWIASPEERARLATNGRAWIARQQGASERHAELLLGLAAAPNDAFADREGGRT